MLLFGLIAVVMMNFAANSLLNRAGIDLFGMDPLGFAGVRLLAGAAMLGALVAWRGGWPATTRTRMAGSGWLVLYLVPFSLAYLTLPSGVGALVLFGVVQITMFAGSALGGTTPRAAQWAGMGLAMAGLAWLLWPGLGTPLDLAGVAFMAMAGIGWGLFSLKGRGSLDPLGDMAMSFVIAAPIALLLIFLGTSWTLWGVIVGVICGAVTSGLGYALWYRVLPRIATTTGAVAQLSVPVIALVAGAALLGEALTMDILIGAAIVLGGIALSVLKR